MSRLILFLLTSSMESVFQRLPSSLAPCSVTSSWKDVDLAWHNLLFKGHPLLWDHLRIHLVTYIVPFHSMAFGIHSNPGGV